MSDTLYDNVIGTETEGFDRERMEMMVAIYESADCVRDHDFRTETNTHHPLQNTGSDCVKNRNYRAAVVCLVLLCVLLLTAVIVMGVYIHTNNTNYTQKKNQLLTNITNLTEERDQLLTNITNLTEERDQLLTNITNLTDERDELLNIEKKELLSKSDDLKKQKERQEDNRLLKYLLEMSGWMYYQSSLYYISSEKKSWNESRRYCTERGADLIIINNKEEQDFVKKMSANAKVWIGLTDSDEEGRWKWVDGSNMTSGFWGSGEPNGNRGENCALSTSGWADYPCYRAYKWICERSTLIGLNRL